MRLRILPLVLALSACSLTPALIKPALPVPEAFPTESGPETQAHAADLGWRTMFGDRRLQRLIERALANNRDLRLAVLNVEAVRAQYNIQRAARLPGIDATGSASRQRTAANDGVSPAVAAANQEQYGVNVGLNAFEIDLFGRVRSLSDAAFARYLASDEGRLAVQISLVGAVADAYFAERLAQEQLQLAEHTLADWRQSLDLARRLKTAKQNSGLDIAPGRGPGRQRGGRPGGTHACAGASPQCTAAPRRRRVAGESAGTPVIGSAAGRDPTAGRLAVRVADPPAGHPASRAEPGGCQCRHRRRARRVLPAPVADRVAGLREPGHGRAVR